MSEVIDTAGASGTSVAVAADQLKVPTPEQRVAAAMAVMGGPAQAQKAPDAPATPPEPPKESLADTIKGWREAREQAARATQAKSTLEGELTKARQELEAAKADRAAFEEDPVGYGKARGWTPEQQLLYGQSLLYDLAPDKADPGFRIKMFEDKQKRRDRDDTRAREEATRKAESDAVRQQLENFYTDTAKTVQSLPTGSHPEVEDWFGDDTESLMTSLMATARNVSAAATKTGQVADLSPVALMKVLEAEVGTRLAARDQRKQKRNPPQAAAAAQRPGGVQPIATVSTKNMNGAGTAAPQATTDKERIQRAIAAAFK